MTNLFRDCHFHNHYGPVDDPLHSFYIPALKASTHYDRSAGFFSSSALAVAAEGVAYLIQNNGHMRLLVGASLSEDDVQAICEGYDLHEKVKDRLMDHFVDPEDMLAHQRLEALSWMVAQGTLEIRVVLPRDPEGRPLPASQSIDYYHPKSAVFTDAEGSQIAFSGSVNELAQAWLHNYENFSVYRSWDFSKEYLDPIAETFERLWKGEEPGWVSLDIPEAVRQRLLEFRPVEPPSFDPVEKPVEPVIHRLSDKTGAFQVKPGQDDAIIFQFLRDAPHLTSASGLGVATAAVTPWPHQIKVGQAVESHFPERFLLADEVGLGKTIEAGSVLRQLLISGRVKRALILAPRSVLTQWQEELSEKFGLRVPLYDGNRYWDLYQKLLPVPLGGGNPWDIYPVVLAGSQLAKRADRHQQLMNSQGWDLVLVDEAHHARRKDFKQPVYRPNRRIKPASGFRCWSQIYQPDPDDSHTNADPPG